MNSNMSSDQEERVIFDTPSHVLFLIPVLAVLMIWFLYLLVICPSFIFLLKDGCLFISGLTFFFIIFVLCLDWINNRLVITDRRVTRRRGIIGKTIMTIELSRIQDVRIQFGILGRIFGFGTLEIESAGTSGKIVFRGIPSPKMVREKIESEIQKATRG